MIRFRQLGQWLGITVALVIVTVATCLGVVTNPGLFMTDHRQYRAITVHTQTPIGLDMDSIMAEVFERLDAVPIYDPKRAMNLVLCSTQDKFSLFARFTLRGKRVLGFCLFGNAYVNLDLVDELAGTTHGRPKYNAREGSVVHVATHELMHQYLSDAYGEIASRSLPTWKVEGYIEYAANQLVAPRDSGYTIPERLGIYLDDAQWTPATRSHRPHYLWGLMMEYLINVKGMTLEQVMADAVTNEDTYRETMAWRQIALP